MYDAILDNFEDEATRTRGTGGGAFADPGVESDEHRTASSPVDGQVSDADMKASEEMLAGIDETESWSDDPVRMYLTQMGEIPLLTRQQEIALAKRIEETRREFRTKLLEFHT